MSEIEDCCSEMAYIYGGISLSPKPPGQFVIPVRVNVGSQTVPLVGPELGDDHALWHYLATVRPGQHKVICTVGDVMSTKSIDAKADQTSIVNFCFGKPVTSFNAKGLPKMRVKRKIPEKSPEKGPTGEGGPAPLS